MFKIAMSVPGRARGVLIALIALGVAGLSVQVAQLRPLFAGSGQYNTGALAGVIVGVILSIVAAVVGINMLPSVISAWVTVSNTTGLDSSAATLTDVGQIVAVVVGIIVTVAVILVVLKIAEAGAG